MKWKKKEESKKAPTNVSVKTSTDYRAMSDDAKTNLVTKKSTRKSTRKSTVPASTAPSSTTASTAPSSTTASTNLASTTASTDPEFTTPEYTPPTTESSSVFRLNSVLGDDFTVLSNDINNNDSEYWGTHSVIPEKYSGSAVGIPVEEDSMESGQMQSIQRLSSVLTDATGLNSVPEDSTLNNFDGVSTLGDENSVRSRNGSGKNMPEVKAVLISIIDVIKLRTYAEAGPLWIGALCFVGGVAMFISVALDLLEKVRNQDDWPTLEYMIFSMYVWASGALVVVLEGRPFQIQVSSVHLWVSDYLKILRFEYGRGLLYTFMGSIQYLCLLSPYNKITGSYMMFVGLITFLIGMAAKVSLDNARAEKMSDHTAIRLKFDFYDIDKDGFLDVGGFQDFVISLGLNELENISYDTAFHAIDRDGDGKISFDELEIWWSVVDYRNQTNILDNRVGANYNIKG